MGSVPQRRLHVWHAAAVCVGMVVGAGIFKSTPLAAANVSSTTVLLAAWVFGGAMSLAGALCFAEMATAFPDAGGDYHFLQRAFGDSVGFLFAWSRFAVIHTGSMAMLAFSFGDYLAEIINLGPHTSSALAAGTIVLLAAVNLFGIRLGAGAQVRLMWFVIAGLLAVVSAGLWLAVANVMPVAPAASNPPQLHLGAALVYVFLAYGGWSDAATLSAEMQDARRGISRALLLGMSAVTVLYVLVNWAYVSGLSLEGLAASEAPAADLMLHAFGPVGQAAIVGVVALTSITSMNALLIAGARTTYAAARDTHVLTPWLGRWHAERGTPTAAILAIATVSLLLVGFGAYTRGGFATMVDYLSPVYWSFLILSGVAMLILRRRFASAPRPFRAPLYPLVPTAFIAPSAYVFYSSVSYVRVGVVVGLSVLALGAVVLLALRIVSARLVRTGKARGA